MSAEPQRKVVFPDRYRVVRRVGRGGMGLVFEAFDQERNLRVALKTLNKLSPDGLYFLKNEFRALAGILHPNLAALYEFSQERDQFFLSMEFIEGRDFLAAIRPTSSSSDRTDSAGSQDAAPTLTTGADSKPTLDAPAEASLNTPAALCPPADPSRVREVLIQITQGLMALHEAGKLHRDIKPSNVLVEPGGVAKVLDFGLVDALEEEDASGHKSREIVGTLAYMSPEQASASALTPASDWFSMGVMLFEALTGRLPHPMNSSASEIIRRRVQAAIPAPGDSVPTVPDDLNDLCVRLLARDPGSRPTGTEVLDILGGTTRPHRPGKATQSASAFVGRERELAIIREAAKEPESGRPAIVLLQGPSGVGKSTLSNHFLEEFKRKAGALVLRGRCYEQESVYSKAIDGIVDRLSRYLRSLSYADADRLIPEDVGALATMFPVLEGVPAIGAARRSELRGDPVELRRRAVAALRELLKRLSKMKRLALYIEDYQWSDVDSSYLLADLLRPPNPPNLMLLCCFRSEYQERSPGLASLLKLSTQLQTASRFVDVQPLSPESSEHLAELLLGSTHESLRERAATIARESGGLPFFISELTRTDPAETDVPDSLESMIWRRIKTLPEESQRLLEVVSVAGGTVAQADAFDAAGLTSRSPTTLNRLTNVGLLRSAGPRELDEVETFHDRIREAVVAHLAPERKVGVHSRLADVFDRGGRVEPEVTALHYEACGKTSRAGTLFLDAAARAERAMAFDRAARLWERGGALASLDRQERLEVMRRQSSALTNAGRCPEAGRRLLEASGVAPSDQKLKLKGEAAYNLMVGGHFGEGRRILSDVCRSLGVPVARSSHFMALSILTQELWFRAKGLDFKVRPESEVPREKLEQIDFLWYGAIGLGWSGMFASVEFLMRGLLRAVDAGEPFRLARALMTHAAALYAPGRGLEARAEREFAAVEKLVRELDDSTTIRTLLEAYVAQAMYLKGEFPKALEHAERAEKLILEESPGLQNDLANMRLTRLWSYFMLGRIGQLQEEAPVLIRDAENRGDLLSQTNIGSLPLPWALIAADRPDEAHQVIDDQMGRWSGHGDTLPESMAFQGRMSVYAYCDEPRQALACCDGVWRTFERAYHFRHATLALTSWDAVIRVHLSLATQGEESNRHLREALRYTRRLSRLDLPQASAYAAALHATVAAVRGDWNRAIRLQETAVREFEQRSMLLFANVHRRRLGIWTGGESGSRLVQQADKWMRSESIANPERMMRAWANTVPKREGRH